jgi:excisionase family DNA binding protein
MSEAEILEYLMEKFCEKFRPLLYEIVTDCLSKQEKEIPVSAPSDELWTIDDVTRYFSCAKTTVYAWRKKGLIKTKKVGNKTYFKKSEIQKLMK